MSRRSRVQFPDGWFLFSVAYTRICQNLVLFMHSHLLPPPSYHSFHFIGCITAPVLQLEIIYRPRETSLTFGILLRPAFMSSFYLLTRVTVIHHNGNRSLLLVVSLEGERRCSLQR